MADAINFYEKQLKEVDELIQDAIEQDQKTRQQSELLNSIPGVGKVMTAVTVPQLPELGKRNRGQIAKLVGVAPLASVGLRRPWLRPIMEAPAAARSPAAPRRVPHTAERLFHRSPALALTRCRTLRSTSLVVPRRPRAQSRLPPRDGPSRAGGSRASCPLGATRRPDERHHSRGQRCPALACSEAAPTVPPPWLPRPRGTLNRRRFGRNLRSES